MNKVWTELEKQYIRDNYNEMKDKELADNLSRLSRRPVSVFAVRKQRQKIGLKKAQGRHKTTEFPLEYPDFKELNINNFMPDRVYMKELTEIYEGLGIPDEE
jgi:hypothetical protein